MLEPDKVKQFWDAQAAAYQKKGVAVESISNLEPDLQKMQLKISDETQKVFAWLPDVATKTILDLGAGVGQWAFRFAKRGAAKVTAVEYSEGSVLIARQEAQKNGITNVEFIISPAEQFICNQTFDIIFISGLFVYLNDDQALQLLKNLPKFARQDSIILLRDGSGITQRHEINDRFSDVLQAHYSATYRTANEYVDLFQRAGFSCQKQENMFPEGHLLNKYSETRLRLFLFGKS